MQPQTFSLLVQSVFVSWHQTMGNTSSILMHCFRTFTYIESHILKIISNAFLCGLPSACSFTAFPFYPGVIETLGWTYLIFKLSADLAVKGCNQVRIRFGWGDGLLFFSRSSLQSSSSILASSVLDVNMW